MAQEETGVRENEIMQTEELVRRMQTEMREMQRSIATLEKELERQQQNGNSGNMGVLGGSAQTDASAEQDRLAEEVSEAKLDLETARQEFQRQFQDLDNERSHVLQELQIKDEELQRLKIKLGNPQVVCWALALARNC